MVPVSTALVAPKVTAAPETLAGTLVHAPIWVALVGPSHVTRLLPIQKEFAANAHVLATCTVRLVPEVRFAVSVVDAVKLPSLEGAVIVWPAVRLEATVHPMNVVAVRPV